MSKARRLAFSVANYPPHRGGVETHTSNVAGRLVARGHEVTIFSSEPRGRRLMNGIEVIGVGRYLERGGAWSLPQPRVMTQLTAEWSQRGIEAVSAHTRLFPITWASVAVGLRRGLRVVLTEHGGGSVASPSVATNAGARLVDRTLGRWSLASATQVMAVSKRSAELVEQLAHRHAVVCGNGVDTHWWAPLRPPESRQLLVFVGRLVPEKGWMDFVALMRQMPPGVSGQIVGGGPDDATVRRAVADAGLTSKVEVVGELGPQGVRSTLRGAVLINPSRAAEGFQTTLLEGALAGARIVTYDVGGAREVADAGATCWVVRPGDSEELARATHAALNELWREAPGLSRYDWEVITDSYEEALLGGLA